MPPGTEKLHITTLFIGSLDTATALKQRHKCNTPNVFPWSSFITAQVVNPWSIY